MTDPRHKLTKAQQLARLQDRAAKLRHQISAEDRRADAHRKIKLGGLCIASGVEEWDPAEIVGALLSAAAAATPEHLHKWRERGIAHLATRTTERRG
jgi:hypothetical protein